MNDPGWGDGRPQPVKKGVPPWVFVSGNEKLEAITDFGESFLELNNLARLPTNARRDGVEQLPEFCFTDGKVHCQLPGVKGVGSQHHVGVGIPLIGGGRTNQSHRLRLAYAS